MIARENGFTERRAAIRRPRRAIRCDGGIDPASQRDDRDLHPPIATIQGVSARSRSAPAIDSTSATARARSLRFVATTSTMRLPKTFPSRTMTAVDSVFSAIFCGGSGLETGRAG